jgi:biotin operon repressor
MSERPVCLRLTTEQVESVVLAMQGGRAVSLEALLSGRAALEGIPPVEVWEERAERETIDSRYSFALARGLLLLAHLADGQPARLADLAADLKLSESAAGRYVQTLLLAGLVEQDPETDLYRLAR